jgi:Cys-tRNA(Pro)/Cys-tRNA(Cys) deacylase
MEMSKGCGIFSIMPVQSAATRFLYQLAIPYRVFEHTRLPASLEEAARERGQNIEQIIRSILFRYDHKYYVMILIAGPGKVSWKRVRQYLSVTRLSLATESEVMQVTVYEVGTVTPFGLPAPVRILADVGVYKSWEVSLGCGVHGAAIIIESSYLHHALGNVEIGMFTV